MPRAVVRACLCGVIIFAVSPASQPVWGGSITFISPSDKSSKTGQGNSSALGRFLNTVASELSAPGAEGHETSKLGNHKAGDAPPALASTRKIADDFGFNEVDRDQLMGASQLAAANAFAHGQDHAGAAGSGARASSLHPANAALC